MSNLMGQGYLNPPVDARLYLSQAQTRSTDGLSTNTYDAKAAGLFPQQAYLVIEPLTINADKPITVQVRQSVNSNMSSADTLHSFTISATTTEQIIIPLSNTRITKRYMALYYDVTSGDTTNAITAYLTTA